MLLIADNKPRRGAALAKVFFRMGILASTRRPIAALGEISPHVSALIVVEPNELADTEDYLHRVRTLCRTVPVFAFSESAVRASEGFDDVFVGEEVDFPLLLRMREACERNGQRPVGDYALAGMDASFYQKGICLRSQNVPMTKTERMLLRYLFSTYPARVSAEAILRCAFLPEKTPEPSCVRAHICAINKKVEPILSRPLIDSVRGEGYRVITPEVLERRNRGIYD